MAEFQCYSRLLIKLLLLLWIIAVAIECADLTKRDVVHRIVLKSAKRPKAHKHHHHHHHSYRSEHGKRDSKNHKHRDSTEESIDLNESSPDFYEDSRESKKVRRPGDKREKNSIESLKEISRENSYEDKYEFRYKKERPLKHNYHRFHKFDEEIHADESRHPEASNIRHSVADNWATTIDDVPPSPAVNFKKKSKTIKSPVIDFTTSFPVKIPPSYQFSEYEPLFPSLPPFPNPPLLPSTFEFNKNPDYTKSQPLTFSPQLPVLQPKPVNQFTNLLPLQTSTPFKPNLSNNYEVVEKGINDAQPTSSNVKGSFQKGIPISYQKSGTTISSNLTNSTLGPSSVIFKNDIKKIPTTRSSKRKLRINSNN